jgi:hypothetical protein
MLVRILSIGLGVLVWGQNDELDAARPNAVSKAEIGKLVAGLGDSSYDTRTVAYRQLCVIGVDAREQLEVAAKGSDAEAAIRATQILSILEQLLFTGCRVALEFSSPEVAWDEPVDLLITISNESNYDARIPFDLPKNAAPQFSADARQVADMLDASEWLGVRSAGGSDLELRMDDTNGDAQVGQAVQSRLDNPSGSVLAPGETVVVRVKDFNRGWARYSLLDAGEYFAVLDYKPQWDDVALIAARAGRVASNTARLRIKESAPADVSRAGSQAAVLVERIEGNYVAKLRNATDQPMVVNVNLGSTLPFAFGHWTLECGENRRDLGPGGKSGQNWEDFDASQLVEVRPGATVELGRVEAERVRNVVREASGANGASGWTIHFTYTNLADRNWQVQQGEVFAKDPKVPAVLKSPLPRRLLTTRLSSERLAVPANE